MNADSLETGRCIKLLASRQSKDVAAALKHSTHHLNNFTLLPAAIIHCWTRFYGVGCTVMDGGHVVLVRMT